MITTSLRELRTGFPLTIRGLAEEAGISPTTYMLVESGKRRPNPSTMTRIAAVLQCKVGDVTEFRAAMEAHRRGKKGGRS